MKTLLNFIIKRTRTPTKYLKWPFLSLPTCIKRTLVIHSTTQHARHRKCEKLPPTNFNIFTLKNVTWRTYLISFTVQRFCLYRACFTHLSSSNLSCNLCLWYYHQLVPFNKEINANVYRHSLWEYSKRFHCSFEWHLTPHMTLSIETCIRRTPCLKRTPQHSTRVFA